MMKVFKVLFVLSLLCTSVFSAHATPIQWTGAGNNGHWYEAVYVESLIKWQPSYDEAIAAGGYLVSIGSGAENKFVSSLISDLKFWKLDDFGRPTHGPWTGGYQPQNSSEPSGDWNWTSGEAFSYTDWAPGEPNNYVPIYGEDRIAFNRQSNDDGYKWNDLHRNATMYGYVIEYNSSPVPEPATMMLLSLGLLGVAGVSRRKN